MIRLIKKTIIMPLVFISLCVVAPAIQLVCFFEWVVTDNTSLAFKISREISIMLASLNLWTKK